VASVKLENLRKSFGVRVNAVRGVNLDIADGQFVVFVGPSGCGKTTTLNLIAGLEEPTGGDVYIAGERVTDREPRDRNLGMVFQSLALFPHMTVFENIAFPLRIKKVPEDQIRQRVGAVTDTVRIPHLLEKRPAHCSGGEAQRVALARTIVMNPAVFLMDEPLSSLDAKLRLEMRTEIKRLHESLRATFIYVTHDQAEAMTMADRVVVMRDGTIQQDAEPLEIYRNPANLFVAGFFGTPSMNFLQGELREGGPGGGMTFRTAQFGLALPIPAGAASHSAKVILGIRPEHVLPRQPGTEAAISLVEPLGDETILYLDYGGEKPLVAKADSSVAWRTGERIPFALRADAALFFDPDTGARLFRP
jgi:multiple sugar transport system ATP-binding protein